MRITFLFFLGACSPEGGPGDSGAALDLAPEPPAGRLLIEELSYAGAPPAAGTDHYYADQFIELVNVSEAPVQVGGLLLGDVYGLAGEINRGDSPNSYAAEDPDHVYLENVWRIPGEPEDVLLAPGASLVIAHDGTNHQPFSSVDLSGADYEAFVDSDEDTDVDYPTVANLESLHFTGGYDWLMTVFGPSVVVLAPEAEGELEQVGQGWRALQVAPVEHVIDALETLMDGESGDFKRLPDEVDRGFVYVSGTYTGESVQRVRDGEVLLDTDDSGADFVVSEAPAPRG